MVIRQVLCKPANRVRLMSFTVPPSSCLLVARAGREVPAILRRPALPLNGWLVWAVPRPLRVSRRGWLLTGSVNVKYAGDLSASR